MRSLVVAVVLCLNAAVVLAARPDQTPVQCAEGVCLSDEEEATDSSSDDESASGDGSSNSKPTPDNWTNPAVPDCGARERTAQRQKQRDDQRGDRRRRNFPEYEANHCVMLDKNDAGNLVLRNTCAHDVEVGYCVYKPDPDSWGSAFACEEQKFGTVGIPALEWSAAAGIGSEDVEVGLAACKSPESSPVDLEFKPEGADFRCYKWRMEEGDEEENSGVSVSIGVSDRGGSAGSETACSPEEQKYREDAIREQELAEAEARREQQAREEKARQQKEAEKRGRELAQQQQRNQPGSDSGPWSPPSTPDHQQPEAFVSPCQKELDTWLSKALLLSPTKENLLAAQERRTSSWQQNDVYWSLRDYSGGSISPPYNPNQLRDWADNVEDTARRLLKDYPGLSWQHRDAYEKFWKVCYVRAKADYIERTGVQ